MHKFQLETRDGHDLGPSNSHARTGRTAASSTRAAPRRTCSSSASGTARSGRCSWSRNSRPLVHPLKCARRPAASRCCGADTVRRVRLTLVFDYRPGDGPDGLPVLVVEEAGAAARPISSSP
jgi:hypothetical protein